MSQQQSRQNAGALVPAQLSKQQNAGALVPAQLSKQQNAGALVPAQQSIQQQQLLNQKIPTNRLLEAYISVVNGFITGVKDGDQVIKISNDPSFMQNLLSSFNNEYSARKDELSFMERKNLKHAYNQLKKILSTLKEIDKKKLQMNIATNPLQKKQAQKQIMELERTLPDWFTGNTAAPKAITQQQKPVTTDSEWDISDWNFFNWNRPPKTTTQQQLGGRNKIPDTFTPIIPPQQSRQPQQVKPSSKKNSWGFQNLRKFFKNPTKAAQTTTAPPTAAAPQQKTQQTTLNTIQTLPLTLQQTAQIKEFLQTELKPDSNLEQVRRMRDKYKKLMMKIHPDKHPGNQKLQQLAKQVNNKKQQFDRFLQNTILLDQSQREPEQMQKTRLAKKQAAQAAAQVARTKAAKRQAAAAVQLQAAKFAQQQQKKRAAVQLQAAKFAQQQQKKRAAVQQQAQEAAAQYRTPRTKEE